MDVLSRDELRALAAEKQPPCVTIFLPMHRNNREEQQDQIRFKNLLREAEDKIVAFGMRAADARALLEPAQRLLNDSMFWQRPSPGLAVFVSPTQFRFYRLPFDAPPFVLVNDRFHVKRLLRFVSEDATFYVLALSVKGQSLYMGTRYDIDEVEVPRLPGPMEEALGYDIATGDQMRGHIRFQGASPDQGIPAFHGHGAADEGAKDKIRQYFRMVADALHDVLREERAPLVLAGVEYLHPLFRDANTYAHLVETGIRGNPEAFTPDELHAAAWEIVEPHFVRAREHAKKQFEQLAGQGTGRASDDLGQIVAAAHFARVDALFVAVGVHEWGRFDQESGAIERHDRAEPGDEDLLDLAAVQSFLHGGNVFVVPPEQVPGNGRVAATFRF